MIETINCLTKCEIVRKSTDSDLAEKQQKQKKKNKQNNENGDSRMTMEEMMR